MNHEVEQAWTGLHAERERLGHFDLRQAFATDPERAARYRIDAAGIVLDFSRNLLDDSALLALLRLATASDVAGRVRAQFAGENVNLTEHRAVLHTLLRGTDAGTPLPQAAQVSAALQQMERIVEAIRGGRWQGFSGLPIRDVVNIGIGGSHLGPCFVADALSHLRRDGPRTHFVSNVDPRDLEDTLQGIDAGGVLFVVASKTFGTLETLENARSAREWLLAAGCPREALGRHFVAVSANVARAVEFGIDAGNVLPMWDWVGGRYSLWSAIGLPVALGTGMDSFHALLGGAHEMDLHFRDAPAQRNMPLLLALLSVWYRNLWGAASQAVIPYDQRLARLPEYLQQLVMESNGKSVDRAGVPLARESSGVLWGAAGTNGQHSFHQLLHQGTGLVPVDFVLPLRTHAQNRAQHAHLVANGIAQAQALMLGRTCAEAQEQLAARGVELGEAARLAPHLVMSGNRPSNMLLMHSVTPATLGALLALYEHRTAAEGYLWDLNSFDQYGVELGKQLGEAVHRAMVTGAGLESMDASTAGLIAAWRGGNPN